jgi:hypothetical protein
MSSVSLSGPQRKCLGAFEMRRRKGRHARDATAFPFSWLQPFAPWLYDLPRRLRYPNALARAHIPSFDPAMVASARLAAIGALLPACAAAFDVLPRRAKTGAPAMFVLT